MKNASSPQNYQILIHRPLGVTIVGVDDLSLLAETVCVPFVICEARLVDASVLSELCAKLSPVRGQNARMRLIVSGCHLEEQLSVSILHMLAVGFDVYILRDFAVPIERQHAHIFDQRLLQSGAVPITLRQLFYEWLTSEIDNETRQNLLKCGKEFGLVHSAEGPS